MNILEFLRQDTEEGEEVKYLKYAKASSELSSFDVKQEFETDCLDFSRRNRGGITVLKDCFLIMILVMRPVEYGEDCADYYYVIGAIADDIHL